MNTKLIRSKMARKVTLVGFFVNILLTIFKLMAGIIGKSSAMMADAIHSLSDFLTDIVVLIAFKLTSKPEDDCHNYGHDKYETLTTVMISLVLAFVAYKILKSGLVNVVSLIKGEHLPRPKWIAFLAALLSIVLKEVLYRYTVYMGKKINSPSIIANAWHHRSDAFSSIGTTLGIGGAILLGENWIILDPIASIIVSFFIFKVSYEILIPSINELVEESLDGEAREQIEAVFYGFTSIKEYHKLRMRKFGTKIVIECHIMVDERLNIKEAHEIATQLELRIKDLIGEASIITIHIEPYLR